MVVYRPTHYKNKIQTKARGRCSVDIVLLIRKEGNILVKKIHAMGLSRKGPWIR